MEKLRQYMAKLNIIKDICGKPCDLCKMYSKKCMPEIIATKLSQLGYRKQVEAEWISVEDRLPINDYEKHWKDRNYYLVYTEPSGLMYVAKFGYEEHGWWVDSRNNTLCAKHYSKVTHYMPLPTPPKMKGE